MTTNFPRRHNAITFFAVVAVLSSGAACGATARDFSAGDGTGGGNDGNGAGSGGGDNSSGGGNGGNGGGGNDGNGGDGGCSIAPGSATLDDVVALSAGSSHTCALRMDGAVYCWGDNSFGQLGVPQATALTSSKPVKVIFPADVGAAYITQIALTERSTFAVDSQLRLWAWGNNESGILANGTKDASPHAVPAIVNDGSAPLLVRKIAPEWYSACALTSTGAISCWGANYFSSLGAEPQGTESLVPVRAFSTVGTAGAKAILAPGIGSVATCFATGALNDGLMCWGAMGGGYLLANPNPLPQGGVNYGAHTPLVEAGAQMPLAEVSYGTNFGCARDSVGGLFCWGTNNNAHQHGLGAPPEAGRAAVIRGTWGPISAGYVFMCAVDAERKLRCRGDNQRGQLGRSTPGVDDNASMDPVVRSDGTPLDKVVAVSAGFFHTCAVLEGACGPTGPGRAMCWGDGDLGQLGDGSGAGSTVPVDVLAP